MNNDNYIPIDQTIIDHEVNELQKKRDEARDLLKVACKDADGNYDIIVFRNDHKRIIRALLELGIFWCQIDDKILVNRHELYDVLNDKTGD